MERASFAVIGAVAFTFVAVSAASADQMLLGSSALFDQGTGTFYNAYTLSSVPAAPSLAYSNFAGGPTTFDLSDSGESPLLGAYSAIGTASYGELNAMISANVSGSSNSTPGSYPLITIYQSDFFFDTLTFNTDSTQTSGTAYLSVTVDGSGSFTGSNAGVYAINYATVLAGEAGSSTFQAVPSVTNTSGQATVLSEPIPFTSGIPVDIEVALSANVFFGCNVTDPLDPEECDDWSASGTTDYSHTALLSGIELFDAKGAPITDFEISSASGTTYGADGIAPEPHSLVLFLSAIVAFSAMLYCKKVFRIPVPPPEIRN